MRLRFRDYFFGIIGVVVVGVVGNRRTEAIVVLRTDRPITITEAVVLRTDRPITWALACAPPKSNFKKSLLSSH